MNISELNQALSSIADEVTDDSRTRLDSVARRVRTARRSKVAGTIVTTCAVVLGLAFLPDWGALPGDNQAPSAAKSFGSLNTIRSDDRLIYRDAAGARLLNARSGAVGADSLHLSITSKTGNIGWTQPCPGQSAGPLQYHLSVNGSTVPGSALERLRYTGADRLSAPNTTCDVARSPLQVARMLSFSPTGNMNAWRTFDVRPDQPALFSLRVTAPETAAGRAALAKAQLTLAVFDVPRHPVHSHGMWVERHIVDPPGATGAFKLVHQRFVKVDPGRTQLTVPAPHSGKQIYVRTFVVRGKGSGVVLRPGAPTPEELNAASGDWSVEKSIQPGPSTLRAAVATVPAGTRHLVAILVYVRYQ
jgi:hypothetical protein